MAYEYEKRNKGVILTGTIFDEGDLEKQPAFEEVEEVYAKAKAFDEILDIDLAQHDEEYADNVMKVVNKYMEDK